MLSEIQIETIIEVLKPYNPKKISVFGSAARGNETSSSDIDILYEFKEPISLFQKASIKENLESRLRKAVDLVSEKYITTSFRDAISTDLKTIYGS